MDGPIHIIALSLSLGLDEDCVGGSSIDVKHDTPGIHPRHLKYFVFTIITFTLTFRLLVSHLVESGSLALLWRHSYLPNRPSAPTIAPTYLWSSKVSGLISAVASSRTFAQFH